MTTKPPIDRTPNSIGCFKPAPLPHTAASGAQDYAPLRPGDLPQPVLRPGALDHEKHGSRQPDGSVKPYSRVVPMPCWQQPHVPGGGQSRFSS